MQLGISGPVHYRDYGGEGPLVVLVHGIASSSASWIGFAEELIQQHRVLAIDLPGFGRSPLSGRSPDVESQADLVATFIDRVADESVVLIGSSLGGLIGFLVASRYPDTVHRLIPISPAVPGIRRSHLGARNLFGFIFPTIPGVGTAVMKWGSSNVGVETHVRFALEHVAYDHESIDPNIKKAIVKSTARWMSEPDFAKSYINTMKSLYPFVLQSKLFDAEIADIVAPTHIIGGYKDPVVAHRNLERVMTVRPDWELTLLEKVGHAPHIEEPQWLAEIVLEWLRAPANV